MAISTKTGRPAKPTVFLSHSSANRRELLGLKRLLDERAGGLIDFFLSSDDDSIAHGTIWPAEVQAALNRMTLMLIFVSTEALKSGWTYFEAGYGLHKLGSAKIYCLPGSDKASLPSPFNILQNRNLHSVRDVGLLIKQCNGALGAKLRETVSQDEFDRIFKKPLTVKLETGPSFEQLVRSVKVSAMGPANSAEIFSGVCQKKRFAVSPVPEWDLPPSAQTVCPQDIFFSTGLRLSVARPRLEELKEELPVENAVKGFLAVDAGWDGQWVPQSPLRGLLDDFDQQTISVAEANAHNEKIRKENEEIERQNNAKKLEPRECNFELSPTNISVPIGIIDGWIASAKVKKSIRAEVYLSPEVQREIRVEAITAKIHGSELSLRQDGSYLWRAHTIVQIKRGSNGPDLELKPLSEALVLLSALTLQELVATLLELNVISLAPRRSHARK